METIVFIGTYKAGSSRDGIIAAKELGYYTILLTPNKRYLNQRNEFPDVDRLIYIEKMSYTNLYNKCIELKESGINIKLCISFIDPHVSKAAKLSTELNLSQLSTESLYKMEDKSRFREILKGHPSTPFFKVYNIEHSLESCYQECKPYFPIIVKPPISNGSKDIFFVETEEEFYNKVKYLTNKHKTPVLIEQFVSGTQYIVEVIVNKGVVTIAGVIEQELNTNFVVTGYAYPAILNAEHREKLDNCVKSVLEKLGLHIGSCHLEMRLSNDEWKLIEINPRMSGSAMNQIIKEGSGIDLAKETIKLYLGKEPAVEFKPIKNVFAQFVTVNNKGKLIKVTGRIRASKHKGVKKVFISPRKGSILRPPTVMGYRYAYVIASSDTPETAKAISKKAANVIKFHLDPI